MKLLSALFLSVVLFSGNAGSVAADYLQISTTGIYGNFLSDILSDEDEKELIKKEISFNPGEALNINLESGGGITISGWSENKLVAEFHFPKKDSHRYDIEAEKTNDGAEIFVDFKKRKKNNNNHMNVEIKVPVKATLNIETKGGSIKINNIEGEIFGTTYGGELNFSDLKGNINFKTYGGNVNLVKSKVDGKIETMGGGVFFEDVDGSVSGKTMGGSVIYKNVTNKSTDKEIDISTMGGSIELDKAFSGANIYTAGGSIEVGTAKKHISAKTMGGSISIDEIDGGVEASTMGGNIEVKVIEQDGSFKRDVDLSSMGGDITLYVPAKFSMDVDLEIENTDADYKIVSDFELRRHSDDDNLTASGSVNGGKNKVSIKTMNGNIYLKKI